MIAVHTYDRDGCSTLDDPSEISEIVGRDSCLIWVDMLDPGPRDFACVQEEFGLHPLAMEDAAKHGQRPKLERYPTHAFLVAYSKEMAEIDLFVGPTWLVSVRERNEQGEHCAIEPMERRYRRTRDDTSVGTLLYTILDEIVDGYFSLLEATEDRIDAIEDQVFDDDDDVDDAVLQRELFAIRRELLQIRRRVAPLREVLVRLLHGEVEWLDSSTRLSLQDVHDHVLRALDHVETQRELVSNAVDAHLALASNRMNRVMKRMTSWGAIILGSTLIAGIYGMNFQHMPELGTRYGYPGALAAMVVLTLVLYRAFNRRGWL